MPEQKTSWYTLVAMQATGLKKLRTFYGILRGIAE
jgi:hypothetical protein